MPHKVVLPDVVLDGIKATKLTIEAGGSITLAPNWPIVLGKWAAQTAGEDAALEAGEVAAAAVRIDAVIAGSFVAVGLAVIFGTLYSLAQGSQIGDLAMSKKPGIVKGQAGLQAGDAGLQGPHPTRSVGQASMPGISTAKPWSRKSRSNSPTNSRATSRKRSPLSPTKPPS